MKRRVTTDNKNEKRAVATTNNNRLNAGETSSQKSPTV